MISSIKIESINKHPDMECNSTHVMTYCVGVENGISICSFCLDEDAEKNDIIKAYRKFEKLLSEMVFNKNEEMEEFRKTLVPVGQTHH